MFFLQEFVVIWSNVKRINFNGVLKNKEGVPWRIGNKSGLPALGADGGL